MTGYILTFIAVLLAGVGARDQIALASLVRSHGARPGLLVIAVIVSIASCALAGWAATLIAPSLPNGNARLFLAALALGFAGGEALVLSPGRDAKEPTHSLAALAVVLAFYQLTDAARFLVFGIGVASSAPLSAALGGAAASIVLLGAAWSVPELFVWHRLRGVRRVIGAVLLALALYLGLRAMQLF